MNAEFAPIPALPHDVTAALTELAEALQRSMQTDPKFRISVDSLSALANAFAVLETAHMSVRDDRSALERRQDEIEDDRATEAAEWEARDRFIEGYDA